MNNEDNKTESGCIAPRAAEAGNANDATNATNTKKHERSFGLTNNNSKKKRVEARMKMRPSAALARRTGVAAGEGKVARVEVRSELEAAALSPPSQTSGHNRNEVSVLSDDARKKRAKARISMRPLSATAARGGGTDDARKKRGAACIYPLAASTARGSGTARMGNSISLEGTTSSPGAFTVVGPGVEDETMDVEGGRQVAVDDGSAQDEQPPINDGSPVFAFVPAMVQSVPPFANAKSIITDKKSKKSGVFKNWRVRALLVVAILAIVGVVVGLTVDMPTPDASPTDSPTVSVSTISQAPEDTPTHAPTVSPTVTPAPTMTAWLQVGPDIDGVVEADNFGFSVSLSENGSRLAVGACCHDVKSDRVQVFEQNDEGEWSQLGGDLLGGLSEDRFGYSVSMAGDGKRLAVGSPGHNGKRGQVKVFQLVESGTWDLLGSSLVGEGENDWFGTSVSISDDGNIVVVGAGGMGGEDNGAESEAIRVFQFSSGNWTQLGKDIDGEGPSDRSGCTVSSSADGLTVAIGAHGNVGEVGSKSGHVRVYTYHNDSWNQIGKDIEWEAADDLFGYTVSLSSNGSVVAVGGPHNDGANGDYSGHVRVYQYEEKISEWLQLGGDIDGEAAGDTSGWSVSLSSDGNIIAVGADYNSENGYWSGHVRIFKFDGNEWVQVGAAIEGKADYDESGYSVSLSGDGNRVAIGAPRTSTASESGYARVFHWPESS